MSNFRSVLNVIDKLLRVAVVVLLAVALYSVARWKSDSAKIREWALTSVDTDATPSLKMRQMVQLLTNDVGYRLEKPYYLIPLLQPLRATPLQVIESGGNCAHRARALIAGLRQVGVKSSKMAVYHNGRSVHAVVQVQTERGVYIVDPLFNVIHEREDGTPIPLASMDSAALAESLRRAAQSGNAGVVRYPIDTYQLNDVWTINWTKSAGWRTAGALVSVAVGAEQLRVLPRPYLSEEPALMVVVLAVAGVFACLFALWLLRRTSRDARLAGVAA